MNTLNSLRHGAFALLACLALGSAASAQPSAPAVLAVVNGSYTVTYPAYCDPFMPPGFYCSHVYLLEKTEPNGQWAAVSEGGSFPVSSRAPGTYSYMVWAGVYDPWYSYYDVYSAVTTVVVAAAAPPAPARDNILNQLSYGYEVRRGDFNWDGRTDLFIRKTSGGTPYNGTVENLILRQDSAVNGNFAPVVPTPDQALVAAAWAPAPSIGVRLHDIDVDGFVDLTLVNLASVVSGAADQIVYSPGQAGQAQPGGMRRVDSGLTSFIGDAMDLLVDPNHIVRNAPLYYYESWAWYAWCPLLGIGGIEVYYWQAFTYCYIDYVYYFGFYYDFSAFHPSAVALWSNEDQGETGGISRETAMSTIKQIIEGVIQSQVGGWPMEEIFGQAGPHTDEWLRRAIETTQAVIESSRAFSEHVDMDNLPPQRPRARDVIHVTGHELFLNRVGHLALEYAPPQLVPGLYDPTTLSGYAEHWPPVACLPGMGHLSFCGWGKLLAQTNRVTDHWYSNFKVGELLPALGTAQVYWNSSLVPRHNRYINVPYVSKPDYNALPDAGTNSYNSNSYVRGLGTGGLFAVPPAMNSVYPGWNRPVPNALFQ
jgi:hypothetical protein